MNKLNLKAYGVSEMTKEEMQETNGGGFFAILGAVLLGIGIALCAIWCVNEVGKYFDWWDGNFWDGWDTPSWLL